MSDQYNLPENMPREARELYAWMSEEIERREALGCDCEARRDARHQLLCEYFLSPNKTIGS